MHPRSLLPGILGAVSSSAGAVFAAISTADYARHLDRQLHATNCSFIPGLEAPTVENACTAAMQSPYSAVLKDRYWGGVPISLFGLGAFAFLLALSLYLLIARENASKAARLGFFMATAGPLLASLVMLVISLVELGDICKVCAGIYVSSAALFGAGVLALVSSRKPFAAVVRPAPPVAAPRSADPDATSQDPEPWHQKPATAAPVAKTVVDEKPRTVSEPRTVNVAMPPKGNWTVPIGLLAALGTATAIPAAVYAASLPDYRSKIVGCGKLLRLPTEEDGLVKVPTTNPVQRAITFEDPLCPTCKAFHDRLVREGMYDKLDLSVAIFPLDSECNKMLKRPFHPGACVLARAFLCGDKTGKARTVLEWSYDNQDELREAGKADVAQLRAKVKAQFPDLDACIDTKETTDRLNKIMFFAIENKIRISTPQLYLGDARVCDEDTDIGLRYTISELAPEVRK